MRGINTRLRLVDRPFGRTDQYDLQGPQLKIHAFALTERGKPQVFEYELTDDGLDGLMNLIQSEGVLAVVHGCQVPFQAESRVVVSIAGTPVVQSTLLRKG